MLDLKVAFQGGGARLVTLIAAADALRDLENEGLVKVELVAGTSAGSIAACMFASGLQFAPQLQKIREVSQGLLKKIGPSIDLELLSLANAFSGTPIYKERYLRQFLKKIFYDESTADAKPIKLQIPTYITMSDIVRRAQRVEELPSARDLVDVVCDSCALPFIFRTYKSLQDCIDGGISSNLPATVITTKGSDQSLPLAFKFESNNDPKRPRNAKDYATAILSTAIEHSVELAAEIVNKHGGCVCTLPQHFDTLEFKAALDFGLREGQYTTTKRDIKNEILRNIKPYEVALARNRILARSASRDQVLYDAHNSLIAAFPYRITETTTLVCAKSLYDPDDKERFTPNDDVYQSYKMTADQPVVAVRIALPFKGKAMEQSESCYIVDRNGDEIPVRCVFSISNDPTGREDSVEYVLAFLVEPAQRSAMPLTVTYRTVLENCMGGVPDGKADWMRSRTGELGAGSTEKHILMVPENFPRIDFGDLLSDASKIEGDKRREKALRHTDGRWVEGRPMTPKEQSEIFSRGIFPPKFGWRAMGWTANNVPNDYFSGVVFYL